ncbi:helix-turn-helix transcriptional regulator [Janthinobacterium sp. P210005]|uniref:helix-turn-helix transcriptional regulator n=1 Tax=Janthinobacterium sp. P210005 TaxID=3112938 RepID=UPI003FA56FE1
MKYLTKTDVAALLRVSVRTITTYMSQGLLPQPRQLGRKLLWDESALVHYIERSAPVTSKLAMNGPAKRGRPRKSCVY